MVKPHRVLNGSCCATVNAWTVFEGRIILVKHRKLGIWLAPGGHIEENELPHLAAEREFFEETGVAATVLSAPMAALQATESEYLPMPFYCNLHMVNKPRGDSFCANHYSWGFFVRVQSVDSMHDRDEGIEQIGLFDPREVEKLETTQDILAEARYVFSHFPSQV